MRILWTLAIAGLAVGCSNYTDGRVPVIGKVTLDGTPLSDVYLTFRPDDGEPGNGGFAISNSQGQFEIYYPDTGKGLKPARYKVTVTSPPRTAVADKPNVPSINLRQQVTPSSNSFPPIYSSPENTPLRVTVAPDGQPVRVEMKSTPQRPPPRS